MTTPSIVFYNRDYTGKIALPVMPVVERYSHNMIGGPEKAYLSVPQHADMWDLMKLLRCPVEIYGGDGRLNWWGYVNRIGIPHGDQRIGLGLDNLFNYVSMEYTGSATTTPTSNAVSIAEYGQKEKKLTNTNATLAEANQAQAIYLTDHEYARPEIEFTGGNQDVKIECYGWYQSLEWKYYTTTDTSNIENTTQISTIVTNAGQFLRGTLVEHIAGITSSAERDGSRTALDYVNELLDAGTTDVRPLLSLVDRDRYLHVYERTAEPAGTADYLLRDDGNIITPLNQLVPPEHCIAAKWVQVQGVPISGLSTVAMRPFFIETAEYNAAQDKTTYRAAGAYEQSRLAKFVKEKTRPPGTDDFPPYIPPTTGGGTMSYAVMFLDSGVQAYYATSGITFTSTNTSATTLIEFTIPSDGLYLIGIQADDSNAGTSQEITVGIEGVNNYTTVNQAPYAYSNYVTRPRGVSLTVADHLDASTAITLRVVRTSNGYPQTLYAYAVRLSS